MSCRAYMTRIARRVLQTLADAFATWAFPALIIGGFTAGIGAITGIRWLSVIGALAMAPWVIMLAICILGMAIVVAPLAVYEFADAHIPKVRGRRLFLFVGAALVLLFDLVVLALLVAGIGGHECSGLMYRGVPVDC